MQNEENWPMRLQSTLLAAMGCVLVGLPALSAATTIDFESLEVVGSGTTSAGASYEEDGFLLTAVGIPNPHFQFFETLEPRYPGSTALFISVGAPSPGTARLEALGGVPFSLTSIDLARVNAGGGFVQFTGHLEGGGTVFQEFVVPTGDIALQTFAFSGFDNLSHVTWTEEFELGHQFDNIVVVAVPEPSTAFLALLGLLWMAHPRSRRP